MRLFQWISFLVLQHLVEPIRFCIMRVDHVSDPLGLFIDYIHHYIGIVFGGNVPQTGRKLGVNDTSANV